MERLTRAAQPKRAAIWPFIGIAFLLLGPRNLAWVVSFVGSVVMWPFTRTLEFGSNGYEVANLQLLLIYLIVVLGMNVFFQTGLFSIGHSLFFAIGAYTVGWLTLEHDVNYWLALPAAVLLAGGVGFVLGMPAGRLGNFTFAMITLGYAIVGSDLLLEWESVTGGGEGLLGIELPAPFDDRESLYWLIAAFVAVTYMVVRNLMRSPYGRAAKAIEAGVVAAQSMGVDTVRVKVRTFTVSAAFAGIGGALFAPLQGLLGPSTFGVNLAILFMLMVLLGGSGTVVGPIVGAVLLYRLPIAVESVTDNPGDVSLLVYGVVLVASIYVVPRGLMSAWWRLRAMVVRNPEGRAPARQAAEREDELLRAVIEPAPDADETVLDVDDARLSLGGVNALDGASLSVRSGTVHALIGPNGSGKTTMLNVICGYAVPDAGGVELIGRPVRGMRVHQRVAQGVARTFQTPQVFDGVSCAENVMVALDYDRSAGLLSHLLGLPRARREERESYARAIEILVAVGLEHRLTDDAATLPPGERRLLELARVIALSPRLVLMDEPAGGLNASEAQRLERFVKTLRRAGVAVLLVEHRMDMVMRLADQITVLEYGQDIAHGTPREIRQDVKVIAAYLGSDFAESVERAEELS